MSRRQRAEEREPVRGRAHGSRARRAAPRARRPARASGRSATSMTLLICQNASTERWPQPSTWYHSSRVGEGRDQRRVVDRDDGRVEHVAGRSGSRIWSRRVPRNPRRARHPVDEPGPEVDEVDRLVRRRHDVRPAGVVDELRDDPPDRDVLVVVRGRVAAARSSASSTFSTAGRRRRCRRSSTRKRTSAGRSRRKRAVRLLVLEDRDRRRHDRVPGRRGRSASRRRRTARRAPPAGGAFVSP